MSKIDERPLVWVGHVLLEAPDVAATSRWCQQIGMRLIFEEADRVAVLELRGGTHLVVTPGVVTPGDEPVSEGADAPFDLMVENIEEAHDRYAAAGLEPGDIASGSIHSSFGMVAPSGHVVTVNSSHVGDRPV